jgi:hypothetical protein
MTIPLASFPPTLCHLPPPASDVTKIGIIGNGEVVHTRLWPALQSISAPIEALVVCSLEPESGLEGLPHRYYQVERDNLLPLDALCEQGFLGQDTLWIVATPPVAHVSYVADLAGWCRVGVEKPLAANGRQAQRLRPFATGFGVYCLSHKVFNVSVLAFLEACQSNPSILHRVHHIEGVFYETAGLSHGRQQEDGIIDVQWHLFATALVAPFKAASRSPFDVTVERVRVATHEPDPHRRCARPTAWTASRVQGKLVWHGQVVTYDNRQAKGAPTTIKRVRFFDRTGTLLSTLDLNETGHQAHARMLQALLQPVVDMRLTLADALGMMELIDASREMVQEEPSYAFGHLPGFLAAGTVRSSVLPPAA